MKFILPESRLSEKTAPGRALPAETGGYHAAQLWSQLSGSPVGGGTVSGRPISDIRMA